ncbi:MAG TPA: 6,7-dimethyl-8-ribityllumazine synthase [Caldimonas sp.]|jgi:6,7-dimethyl-8-ribityllumazine synthase|nr:6,7-dimethyl-8-ribityllumazine synthase [Caldimonas sp.]HEX4235513.1 6,7-dimethyl-8-ribityllumazine synthase [Caldimonas sp.]
MRNADRGDPVRLDGRELRVGVVQARFNAELTDRIARTCINELIALGVAVSDVTHVLVPGALEIGIALNALADADEHDALVAVGCVLRGETYHFELVANESGAAVTRVAIDHGIAIANAILTCDTQAQAEERADDKGRDAARVAVEMANLLDELS